MFLSFSTNWKGPNPFFFYPKTPQRQIPVGGKESEGGHGLDGGLGCYHPNTPFFLTFFSFFFFRLVNAFPIARCSLLLLLTLHPRNNLSKAFFFFEIKNLTGGGPLPDNSLLSPYQHHVPPLPGIGLLLPPSVLPPLCYYSPSISFFLSLFFLPITHHPY